ncbi:MAG TPA: hypothetical protein VMX17_08565 [Candidatus Glassbacteria bacterium]|nr:hypothetical protein [Candidatus Glassbacteria bacterium]
MKTVIKNIGNYMVVERIEANSSFGKDIYYGNVKYRSPQSNVEPIYKNRVTYLKKHVESKIILNEKEYDLVLYYNLILNFIYKGVY